MVLTTLRVPHNHPSTTQFGKHFRRHFARVRTGCMLGNILGAVGDAEFVTLNNGLHRADISERDGDCNVYLLVVFLRQCESKLLHSGDCF